MAQPDFRRPHAVALCAPEETISNQGGIQALSSGETQSAAQDTDKENDQSADERMLGKLLDCSFYLINLFPLNSKSLTYTFASL